MSLVRSPLGRCLVATVLYYSVVVGLSEAVGVLAGAGTSLLVRPLSSGGPHPLWILNTTGIVVLAVLTGAYALGVTRWNRGPEASSVNQTRTALGVGLASAPFLIVRLWNDLRPALRPVSWPWMIESQVDRLIGAIADGFAYAALLVLAHALVTTAIVVRGRRQDA